MNNVSTAYRKVRAVRCRLFPLMAACSLAIYCTSSFAQTSGGIAAPYEIPLSIQNGSEPVTANIDPNQNVRSKQLYITVGINGGTPETLRFDTGSTPFNIEAGPNYESDSWLPLGPNANVSPGNAIFYGDRSYGNTVAQATASSVQFYELSDNNWNPSSSTLISNFEPQQGIQISLNTQEIKTSQSLGSDVGGAIVYEYLGSQFTPLTSTNIRMILPP